MTAHRYKAENGGVMDQTSGSTPFVTATTSGQNSMLILVNNRPFEYTTGFFDVNGFFIATFRPVSSDDTLKMEG